MNCREFEAHVHPFVDGELPVGDMAAADAHRHQCWQCASLARREGELRLLLRRQPRETAPPELRARILGRLSREARVASVRPWLLAPAAAVAAAIVVLLVGPLSQRPTPLIVELVDKHIAYAQLDRPAELASGDRLEVEEWFHGRAGMRVTVPDYASSGIRLVGARLADAHEQKAAYLLYEKGRTLLSVFMVPMSRAGTDLRGRRVGFRGHEYLAYEQKGYRTVSWTDGQTLYGLVSMLDYEALLECADRLRLERSKQTRL